MLTFTWSVIPKRALVRLDGSFAGRMLLSAVAAFLCCLALGSCVTVLLADEALPQSAQPIIQPPLKDLPLPDQAFLNGLVSILGLREPDERFLFRKRLLLIGGRGGYGPAGWMSRRLTC
jgi:hypothetical protein